MIYYIRVIWLPNLAECEIIHSARRRYIDIRAEDDIPSCQLPSYNTGTDWLIVLYRRTDWNASTEHRPRQCAGECCCDITPCAVYWYCTLLLSTVYYLQYNRADKLSHSRRQQQSWAIQGPHCSSSLRISQQFRPRLASTRTRSRDCTAGEGGTESDETCFGS